MSLGSCVAARHRHCGTADVAGQCSSKSGDVRMTWLRLVSIKSQILKILESIEVRECLLSLCAVSFVFQFVIKKYKDYDIQNHNFGSCFYGCETWSLTMREERRLRVFENRVLRGIFRPKRDEVTIIIIIIFI
jgi:hypothetical protein